jgi:enamine deaminase RidA (YjgF/YER057c/UK114 family)
MPNNLFKITPETRLEDLGIDLPSAAKAVASYVPVQQTGNLVYTSGQLPWINGELKYSGQLGGELTDEEGYQACRLSALNAISQLKRHLGDLSRVKKIVRLEGVLNVQSGSRWTGQPKVLDGASDLINIVFEEQGLHSRMIYSNSAMPLDCACLVSLIAEVD